MLESASGIILRTRLLTETSLIVLWLTAEHGRIATVAKGARRAKSPYIGKLDLFYEADFTFQRSRRSDLHTLREVALRETHADLRRDLGSLRQASYCTAMVEAATEVETPLPAIYELLRTAIGIVAAAPPLPETILAFELKLLEDLGLAPDLTQTKLTPGGMKVGLALQSESWDLIGRLRAHPAQVQELKQFLHGYLIYHLDKFPSGRDLAIG
jgi:DNA repair protein RecO (recombination protein O)